MGLDRRLAVTALAGAPWLLAACDRDREVPRRRTPPGPDGLPPQPAASAGSLFPLRVEPGKTWLVDASGKPFFLVGESAWSLLAQLQRDDIDAFLRDRRARGYNAVLVNLLECYFSARPPYNSEGRLPFAVPSRFSDVADYLVGVDFDTPVDAYFDLFEHLLHRANALDMLVMVVPCYAGYEGGEQGWWGAMRRGGADALRRYGRYLGRRFRSHRNLLWVQGGDYNVPDRTLVDALAQGICEYDKQTLHTFHGSRGTGAHDWMGDPSWLSLGNIYTREVSYKAAASYRAAHGEKPFILIEAYYENYATAKPDARLTRVSAYQALLSGACGQLSGHDDIWQFRPQWRTALQSLTARSMQVLANVFQSRAWWLLQPDTTNKFLRSGEGEGFERALAAVSSDRSFALAYVPAGGELIFSLRSLAGPRVAIDWVDPVDGSVINVTGSPFPVTASCALSPPGLNSARSIQSSDWVLRFEAVE